MLTVTTMMTSKTMDLTSPRMTIKVVAALKTRCVGAAERGDDLSSTGARCAWLLTRRPRRTFKPFKGKNRPSRRLPWIKL